VGQTERMFLGEYNHTIDDKGRLTLPAKFRPDFQSGVVVTRGIDKCLFAFPMPEWEKLSAQVSGLPLTDASAREFRRLLFSGASDEIPDKQGRILVPAYLREYATLNGEVVIAGLNTHIELWNPETWRATRQDFEQGALDAEHWAKLGI